MMDYIKDHKILSGVIIFIAIIIIATIISLLTQNNKQSDTANNQEIISTQANEDEESSVGESSYGPTLIISNWSEHVENLPTDERDQVEMALYDTLSRNLPKGVSISENTKPEIRAKSYSQKYDYVTEIYFTEFLVDISDLKQTYRIVNQYSDLPREESGLFDYTTMVYCPTAAELIWPAFECMDREKMETGQ